MSRVVAITLQDVVGLVEAQLASISDPAVLTGLHDHLVSPSQHLRNWDYGDPDEVHPCWTVAEDTSTDTAIVYSEHGFGPDYPWGLVSLSKLWFGMDSGWFKSLGDAFVDSFAAADLLIWDVVEKSQTHSKITLHRDLSLDEVFRKRDELAGGESSSSFHVVDRRLPEDGVP